MTEIDPYIRVAWFQELSDLPMPSGFQREDAFADGIKKQLSGVLGKYETPESITNLDDLAQELFAELVNEDVLEVEEHTFAGTYYQYASPDYKSLRQKSLQGSAIHEASARVGKKFFYDTFAGYLGKRSVDDIEASARSGTPLPASDRVVYLGDNSADIIAEIDELKTRVRSDNDSEGLLDNRRERIVSELSAGQELLKAPSVRVRAVAAVLLSTLQFIAEAFAGGIIGELAVKLLEQLRPLLGL